MQTLRLVNASVLDDTEIKQIALRNRREALDLTVRKYRDRIFHHAAYIVKDYQQAMDVTQEVFIKAMREKRFFNEDFKMKAWLFRVTSNLCFNIVRDRKRRGTILESLPIPKSSEPEQFDVVFTSEKQQTILASMDKLTQSHREILMLRYYSDLSYAEIADSLGVKLGTVMSRLSRAKGQLLKVLDDVRTSDA